LQCESFAIFVPVIKLSSLGPSCWSSTLSGWIRLNPVLYPAYFVNQVGLSATTVELVLAAACRSRISWRVFSGFSNHGRKRTLLFSGGLSILAAFVLALTQNLPLLVIANLIMGLSAGCYWTAADTAVMDDSPTQRPKAFAVLVLADSLGGGFGIWGGGILLSLTNQSQTLFFVDSFI